MKKEHPISFTGEMVRAILDGRKSMTRRVIKPQPTGADYWTAYGYPSLAFYPNTIQADPARLVCPYGHVEDILWVKESWGLVSPEQVTPEVWYSINRDRRYHPDSDEEGTAMAIYRADGDFDFGEPDWRGWRSGRFMPRWAARILLELTDVRVERVQDISDGDVVKEGILTQGGDGYDPGPGHKWIGMGYHGGSYFGGYPSFHTSRANGHCACKVGERSPAACAFRELWDSINAKRGFGWDKNPWCWCLSFRRYQPCA